MVIRRRKTEDIINGAAESVTEVILDSPPTADEVDIEAQYEWSLHELGNYSTLDWPHIADIRRVKASIRRYGEDESRKRPLNIMMLAEPGSGKSHLIKCLAESMDRIVSPVMFNMATLDRIEELLQPLDAARNFKVLDKLPLLFLDEFDSDADKYPLLLPLLWDGELHIGHRELKLGKIVIIIAASGTTMKKVMEAAKSMKEVPSEKSKEAKTVDLLSRINGGILEIPNLDPDRRVDKVCLTISLLRHRFGSQLESAPWALLRFVALSRFRYGVRSITHRVARDSDERRSKAIRVN